MHCAVHDVQILLAQDNVLVNHCLLHGGHVVIIHLTADNLDEIPVGFKLHIVYLYLVHLIDDALVVGSQYLSTVCPVSLVTVVLLGVVRSGYVNTGNSTQLTDGKTDLWGRTEALKQICLDTVGAEDSSNALGKHTAVVAAVVTDNNALTTFGESLVYVVGKALCGHAHDVLVHAVGAHTHDTAQTPGTEFQTLIEGINQRSLVLVVQKSLNLCLCFGIILVTVEPLLCFGLTTQNQFLIHDNL